MALNGGLVLHGGYFQNKYINRRALPVITIRASRDDTILGMQEKLEYTSSLKKQHNSASYKPFMAEHGENRRYKIIKIQSA